jgi:hypothetical protein
MDGKAAMMLLKRCFIFLKRRFSILLLLFILAGICIPFFTSQQLDGDDSEYHAARTANYYLAIKQGQFPVRWAQTLDEGFGLPQFLFTYHLPYIVSTLVYVAGPSTFQEAVNISYCIFLVLGTLGMFFWLQKKTRRDIFALLGSIVYITAPYTLMTVFARNAFGEVSFFCVLPWFFFFFDQLIKPSSQRMHFVSKIVLPITTTLLLLTHQPSLFSAVPFVGLYVLIALRSYAGKKEVLLILSLGVLMSAWFWIPAFFERKFTLFEEKNVKSLYATQFPETIGVLVSNAQKTVDHLPMIEIIFVGFLVYAVWIICFFFFVKKKQTYELTFWFICSVVSVFFTLPISEGIWKILPFLHYMQFPWRMLWLLSFSLSACVALILSKIKNVYLLVMLLFFVSFVSIGSIIQYGRPRGYTAVQDLQWITYSKTASSFDEHRPLWMDQHGFREGVETVLLQSEKTNGEWVLHKTEDIKTISTNFQEETTLLYPISYFPGWKATVDMNSAEIQFTRKDAYGRIVISVPAGNHTVTLQMTEEVWDRQLGDAMTLFGICLYALYTLFLMRRVKISHLHIKNIV